MLCHADRRDVCMLESSNDDVLAEASKIIGGN